MSDKRSLILDMKKKGKKDPHTAKWKRCFKSVSKEETDEAAAKICTDSVGYEDSFKEKSKHESVSKEKIVSLIKEKENPRMSKKGLLEYIKTKKVVKTTSKRKMVSEQWGSNNELAKNMRYFKGEKGAIQKVMKYLEKDDLERYLYGKRKDLDSLEDDGEIENIEYLLDNKQGIRDILIRVALRKSEELDEYDDSKIQRHFENAALEAFKIWTKVMSI